MVCGVSWPSPQAFRQASPLSPLQLLATSLNPRHIQTQRTRQDRFPQITTNNTENLHMWFLSVASLEEMHLASAPRVVYLHPPAV